MARLTTYASALSETHDAQQFYLKRYLLSMSAKYAVDSGSGDVARRLRDKYDKVSDGINTGLELALNGLLDKNTRDPTFP